MSIPEEYRKTAETLFPPGGFPGEQGPDALSAAAFADILGIGADYRRLLAENKSGEEMHRFLCHFQNNLDLLIQKTWVEKADEGRKEKLQDRIPGFISEIGQGNFEKAIRDFGAILDELAYLFFGAQSEQEDFTKYTLRIDIQMGLFWWYGGHLGCLGSGVKTGGDSLWAVLLVGICYLTNF
ncbi:MAG: hypothetical protein LBI86_06905 [Treponema sp.]|jgi:hypothetical protein|nr:hypothetical protein [Treponema sp.]